MIDWTARAKSEILETAGGGTDETSETPLSSVSSVRSPGIRTKAEGVSSVSSVGVQPLSEKRDFQNITMELIKAAMLACDYWGDNPADRDLMRLECLATPAHLQIDLLNHFSKNYPKAKHENH